MGMSLGATVCILRCPSHNTPVPLRLSPPSPSPSQGTGGRLVLEFVPSARVLSWLRGHHRSCCLLPLRRHKLLYPIMSWDERGKRMEKHIVLWDKSHKAWLRKLRYQEWNEDVNYPLPYCVQQKTSRWTLCREHNVLQEQDLDLDGALHNPAFKK